MNLATYLDILRRRKWVILITLFTTASTAAIGSLIIAPTYVAETQLQVSASRRNSASYGDVLQAERLMKTYAEIATSDAVLADLMQTLQLSEEPRIQAEVVSNTELIKIKVRHDNPESAATAANAVAELLVTQSRRIREFRNYPVSVIIPAAPPHESDGVNWLVSLLLGVIAGLVGGMGLAFVAENLDTTLHSSSEIEEATDLRSLGELPLNPRNKPVVFTNGPSPQTEAFRTLETNLKSFDASHQIATLMITSAQAGEGKTTTAVNLSIALAQSGRNVVLIDCDLRKPSIHQVLGMPNQIGVSNALIQQAPASKVLKKSPQYGIHVVTSGPIVKSPTSLFSSKIMIRFLGELEAQFDMVVLDVPAALAVADVSVLAPLVDGIALVVSTNIANKQALLAVQRRLSGVQGNMVGVIINRSERNFVRGYY